MISIIVSVYNAEKRLNLCIDSLIKQTYKDIEIVLIDDGSTDDSAKICDSYADKDSRVKVYHIDNRGVSRARNIGIEKSTGDYIMFCDSDDSVADVWCELLYNQLIKNTSAWISCGFAKDYSGIKHSPVVVLSEDEDISFLTKEEYYNVYKTGTSGYLWNKIYVSSVIRENKIRFDENTDYAEDALFNNRYLKYCDNICFINKPLYNYYISDSEGSLSKKYFPDFYDKVKPVYESRKELISEEYMADFCYDYFYFFNMSLDGTFDKRNEVSFFQKIKYNNYILNDPVFKDCIERMTKKESDAKYISMLKKGSYLGIYFNKKVRTLLK